MLERYFLRPTTVDRIRSNWLASQVEHYVEWMYAQKYAEYSITHRTSILCRFAGPEHMAPSILLRLVL
jgi:integrase/recombinase XerD